MFCVYKYNQIRFAFIIPNSAVCDLHISGAKGECGSTTCIDPPPSKCGGPLCPFTFKRAAKITAETDTELPSGTCGNSSCPYADVDPEDQDPNTLCGNKNCPYMTEIKPEKIGCGNDKCPISATNTFRLTTPAVPCPYKYGTKSTHPYTNDKWFVQEAARPYSGSASPYDYLSSLENNYPFDMATNYPLFPITQPTPVPLCPYMTKKKKQPSVCGKPGCATGDYFDNDISICGGPKMYSCDSPNVNPCESLDCKVFQNKPKSAAIYNGSQVDNFCINATCPYGEGICGGQRMYSCDSPNINPCGSPDCKVFQDDVVPKTNSLNQAVPLPDTSKCHSKTCPFFEQLIFCADCGGVMPSQSNDNVKNKEDATKDIKKETSVIVMNEAENDVQVNVEGEDAMVNTDENLADENLAGEKENLDVNEMENAFSEETQIDNVSLYSYPGVQLGHKDCLPHKPMVPQNMGWLWNCIPAYGSIKVNTFHFSFIYLWLV